MDASSNMTKDAAHTLVIGSGTMGPNLALCLALAGHYTALIARRSVALAQAEAETGYLELAEAELLLATADGWRTRLTFGTDLATAAKNIDFAFEAIAENADAKQTLFAAIEDAAPPSAIISSTTSGMAVETVPGSATDSAVMDTSALSSAASARSRSACNETLPAISLTACNLPLCAKRLPWCGTAQRALRKSIRW